MKITAKLAHSQLKINRLRTLWTLIAIVLSTALTTAVFTFVASGNFMLRDLLGKHYGQYGSTYMAMLLIPAIIFGIMIIAMSITVISNVFRISAQERLAQFGIMKCTGATCKQIKDTVIHEGIILSIIGIPVGVITGLVLSWGAVGIANHFFNDLAELVHIMIREVTLSMEFVISWQAILAAAIMSFLTVVFSAWRPACKAAKTTAIQCINGELNVNVDLAKMRDKAIIKRLFGFEGVLAGRNMKRNRKNFRATVIALSVGVVLFVSLGGLSKQAQGIEEFMKPDVDETVISEYISDYNSEINEKTGREETSYTHPISSELGNEIAKELQQYDGKDIWGMGNDSDTYVTIIDKSQVTGAMQKAYEQEGSSSYKKSKGGAYEFPVEIIVIDEKNYENLCRKAGVPTGSTILLNQYGYNDFGHEKSIAPLSSSLREIELVSADGNRTKVDVDGMLTQSQLPKELFYPAAYPVRIVVPKATIRGYTWYNAPENEKGYIKYANKVLNARFPAKVDSSYMENGFSTRVFKIDDYMKVMNIAISFVSVFIYSFVVLLVIIGLTNVISTLSTNVMLRRREFAVLKSVGMTPESLSRMLRYESIFCSIKALAIGLPIGVVITILINLPIRKMYPIAYQVPWLSIILSILMVFIITWMIIGYAMHKLKHQNVIEAIRAGDGV